MANTQEVSHHESEWGRTLIMKPEPQLWQMGPLHLWYKQSDGEAWFCHQHFNTDAAPSAAAPPPEEQFPWQRWADLSEDSLLAVIPTLPDRPVVVKVENPFWLASGSRSTVHVRIPLWVRIQAEKPSFRMLFELPTVILSDTWFGSFTRGELCYWLTSSARRKIEADRTRPFLAICPIQIKNDSSAVLHVEKFCMRVEGLSLFSCEGQIWASETRIVYRGKHASSQIEISKQKPQGLQQAERIGEARKAVKGRFFAPTFNGLLAGQEGKSHI